MSEWLAQFQQIIVICKANLGFVLFLLAVLWGVQLLNVSSQYRLNYLGILPREYPGLLGVIFAPLLHGGFSHLFMNSITLFILVSLVLVMGKLLFWKVTLFVWLLGGVLVWLFGRKACHVGASGLVLGYWGFLLVNAYQHFSVMSVILALVCIAYFGNMWLSVLPQRGPMSWEGHLFGLVAGVLAAFMF